MRRLSKLSITVPCVPITDPEIFSPMVRQSPTAIAAPLTPKSIVKSPSPSFPSAAGPRSNQLPLFLNNLKRHPNQYYHLMSQFTKLSQLSVQPSEVAKQPGHMCKNRYVDVLPYDHSRVILNNDLYVNASLVNVHDRQYILTQGPLQDTVGDFWQMVWQKNLQVIINLTRLVEGGRQKCVQYWPEAGECMEKGDLYIENVEQVVDGDLVKRVFYVTKLADVWGEGESMTVVQLHYLGWPDRGAPNDAEPVRALVEQSMGLAGTAGPLLVHCSAGIGRTGCFVVAHSVIEKLKQDQSSWHASNDLVQDAIIQSRESRKGVVQTAVQFGFCYDLVESWVQKKAVPLSAISSEDESEEDEEVEWPTNLLERIRNFAVWSP